MNRRTGSYRQDLKNQIQTDTTSHAYLFLRNSRYRQDDDSAYPGERSELPVRRRSSLRSLQRMPRDQRGNVP